MNTNIAPETLTRRTAISNAQQMYSALAERALRRATTPADKRFVVGLTTSWMARLTELGDIGRLDTSLPEHARERVEFLTSAVNVMLETDDLMRWLDVFPEAIAELLPPSESTFRAQPTTATTVAVGVVMDDLIASAA